MGVDLVVALRRQEASKFGQACCEQSRPAGRTSRRSDFASATGTLASTCGAKPGRMVNAAATNAATTMAEIALIMTVPCHLGRFGPIWFVASQCYLNRVPRFQDVFAVRAMWFRRPRFLFHGAHGDETPGRKDQYFQSRRPFPQ